MQSAAYAVEARLLGDDRIPALHEDLDGLRGAGLAWLGAVDGDGRLAGALAWSEDGGVLDVERLVVAPALARRGVGTALVRALLDRAGERPAVVATGRDNAPARALYERLGFVRTGDREVAPGLWVTTYRHGS
ncbi:GNAT family N-acetyltransferase [Geodermatophilus sp. TF02-6]|uniref:GNAT family N-acetyltransferase n=1 Tax=Geodermatophilus sp. TF02-6 TaxID=2250575 RepID=UPI0018F27DCE|nr:GNAT family N-acetyltransferase [Geodermatophilus sp. TF02-6]